MHKYFRQIGDYAKDTRHLSLLEHGAYSIMLDISYATEKPLPDDIAVLARLCCARSKEEREAVERVLREFYRKEENGGWTQKRVQKELEDYRDQSISSRYSNFCKAWKKKHGKKQQPIDLEAWKELLPLYLGDHPVADGDPFDYRSMIEWIAINVPTSNQEPVTKNQEPVFPQDYPAGHAAALGKWLSYKREKRQTYTDTGWKTLLNQQLKFTSDQVTESVETSIASNYSGLFTDKVSNAYSHSPGMGWQKKEGAAAFVEAPAVQGTDAPEGWEAAMDEVWGEGWQEIYACWRLVPHLDQAKVRAVLAKKEGGTK